MARKRAKTLKLITIPPIPTTAVRSSREPFSLPKYLHDRRSGVDAYSAIPVTDWFDQLFAIDVKLKQEGIETGLFAGAMDLDEKSIDEACLLLLEKLIDARTTAAKETAPTRRRLITSERLIQHLALLLVEVLHLEHEPTPESLVVLLRELLGGTNTSLIQDYLPENREPKQFAAQIVAQMPKVGVRDLGKMLGLAPSTISRWFKEEEFQHSIDLWRSIFSKPLDVKARRPRKRPPVARNS